MSDDSKSTWDAAQAVIDRFARLLTEPGFREDLRRLARAVLDHVPEAEPVRSASGESAASLPANRGAVESSSAGGQAGHRMTVGQVQPAAGNQGSAGIPSGMEAAETASRAIVAGAVAHSASATLAGTDAAASLIRRFNRSNAPSPVEPVRVAAAGSSPETASQAPQAISALSLVQQRCRIKADAARWAAERRRLIVAGADFFSEVEPRDREIIARAKQIENCYLWTNNPRGPEPDDLNQFDKLGTCFDLVADAIDCVRIGTESGELSDELVHEALQTLAEAQSLLRVNVQAIGFSMDTDQNEVFRWLRDYSARENVYIERYMRINDVPDPDEMDSLQNRLSDLDRRLAEAVSMGKNQRKLLGKIRYESRRIQSSPDQCEPHLRTISAAVEQLLKSGVAASNVELRDYILPVTELFETLSEMPPEMVQVLRSIDVFRNRHPAAVSGQAGPVAWSSEVEEVKQLLQGKAVFLIGGEQRPLRKAAIEEAFGLSELVWETTVEHSSHELFHPVVERPDVVLVLLAIRWSSHSYSEIEDVCRRLGKPLVRLPGGMHPNQIAHQIMNQASNRL